MARATYATIHGITDDQRELVGAFIRRFQVRDAERFLLAEAKLLLGWHLEEDYPCGCRACSEWRLMLALAVQLVCLAAAVLHREPAARPSRSLRRRAPTAHRDRA